MKPLTIGQLARRAGVGVETVRFYERQGLLEEPARRSSGYRQYGEEVVRRLQFIKRAKALGFTLQEIADLIALRLDPATTRAEVRQKAVDKLTTIEGKIHDLKRMGDALRKLVEACDGQGPLAGCPILDALDGTTPEGDTEP
jgi:Hg(II)-responsive transcriptional regulator